MKNGVKTGIFLCECAKVIGDRVDLPALAGQLKAEEAVACIQTHPSYCNSAGLADLTKAVQTQGINRVLLGACSDRIMKKKFSRVLKNLGLLDSQIEMVNLKDHVALVNNEPKAELTRKAAALIGGAAASLGLLQLSQPARADFLGPALILGGGISGFEAARELAHREMESVLISEFENLDEVLARLPRMYPGSRIYIHELKSLLNDVFSDPRVSIVTDGPIEYLEGHVGDYKLGLRRPDGSTDEIAGAAIIVALDREYISEEKISIQLGERVIDQVELEDRLATRKIRPGKMVFWVNGKGGTKSRELSAMSAWLNCQYLIENHPGVTPTLLYPSDIRLPVAGAELSAARANGIGLHAYEPSVHPMVQSGFVTYTSSRDHLDHEVPWETLVVSAFPGPPADKALELSRYLRLFPDNTSIRKPPLKVKAEQEPAKWPFLAGSALEACDLNEALRQGKKAAREVLRLREKTKNGGLLSPLVVVSVDKDLCEGCGLCSEICTCGGVENIKPGPGPTVRHIDPHTCDGGGSCAAACPYEAMKVLNNSTQQLEARVRTVVSHMKETDVLGLVCSWGGQSAAELAAARNLTYPGRLFMIPVRCLGTIDPSVFSMAFLNGANFIMLAGCTPAQSCHYGYGVDHTWFRVSVMKKLLGMSGLERQRIGLGYVDVNEPEAFVRMVNSFVDEAERMGPIHRTEAMQKRLLAAHATFHRPRLRWVLGATLRRPSELEFPGGRDEAVAFDEVLQEVAEDEYLAARIVGALREAPLNVPQIAEALGEPKKKVSWLISDLEKNDRIVRQGRKDEYPLFGVSRPN
ncbi:MAG: hydrogenase iron-sulfur subunit [Syntrophobacteraceae bacterium]